MKRWLPPDLALPLLLVLSLNWLPASCNEPAFLEGLRSESVRSMQQRVRALPASARIDLAVLGDSRSRRIDAQLLCETLELRTCLNLSTSGGDWISVHELFHELKPDLGPESLVVVAVSDFWLEMGGEYPLGVLPASTAYAELGDARTTFASFLPLSLARGRRMASFHAWLGDRASAVYQATTGRPPPDTQPPPPPNPSRMKRSNVDRWYRATTETDRRTRLRQARGVLDDMLEQNPVVLLYLPNPRARERYVDRHYPGRRAHFLAELTRLANTLALPLVSLAGEFPRNALYQDFHHFSDASVPLISRRVADELRAHTRSRVPE